MRKGPEAAPQGLRKILKRSALGALCFLEVNKVHYARRLDFMGEGTGLRVDLHGRFPELMT